MTSSLVLPVRLRGGALVWRLPLLLPVLPFLALLLSDREFAMVDGLLGCFGLLIFGAVLALGIPAAIARGGWVVRKEAEQLRPAWLTCLFLAQLPALAGREADEIPLAMLFSLTCALVATFPFGAEFQQRTVPALLAQPVDRRQIWATKMKVLGVALLLQWATFCLTLWAAEVPATEAPKAAALALAGLVFAWAGTPWGTLLTRSMLAGLVTSVPFPFVGLALTAMVAQALEQWNPLGRGTLLAQALLGTALVLFGPGYILAGFWETRRRWIRLEASDPAGADAGEGVFFGRWKTASLGLTPIFWVRALLAKELRLQTVTVASLLLMLVSLLTRWALPLSWISRELFAGFAVLFGITTLLLAAATPIAEERRLGTLDGHVLLPVSRIAQWWIKFVLALGLALVPVALLLLVNRPVSLDQDLLLQLALMTYAFAFCLLASSATASALRALLLGLGLTAAAAGLVAATAAGAATWAESVTRHLEESALSNPDLWFERARSLPAPPVPEEVPWPLSLGFPTLGVLVAAYVLVPVTLAVALAGTNFARPAGAPHRLGRQFGICLTAIIALALVAGLGGAALFRQQHTARWLAGAWQADHLQRQLSPGERMLKKSSLIGQPASPYDSVAGVQLRVRPLPPPPPTGDSPAPQPAAPTQPATAGWDWTRVYFPLPLTSTNRARIIHDADIPETTRDALRREAAAAGEPTSAPGSGRPPGIWPQLGEVGQANGAGFRMSPELMKRYGLLPAGAPTGTPAPAGTTNPAPATGPEENAPAMAPAMAPAPVAPAPRFRMSPALMKRYGLIPTEPEPKPAAAETNPAPAEAPTLPPTP